MNDFLNFNFQYFDYIGILGATIILILFLGNQFNKISNDSVWYDFGNFVGSAMLVYFAVVTKSLPFVVLNTVWAIVSLKDVFIGLTQKKEKEI